MPYIIEVVQAGRTVEIIETYWNVNVFAVYKNWSLMFSK